MLLRTTKYHPSTAPATKSDTWPSPTTAPAAKSNTWTSPSIAPATKNDTWTSPNAAPATKSDSCAWSSSHMKTHLQCEEQQVSPSNLTKCCACHKKNHCSISEKISENGSHVISNAGPIREWSDHDPSMKPSVRTMRRNRSYFSGSPRAISIEKYDVSCPVLHSNIHQVLRLPRKVTLERHQELRLPRKATRTTRRNRSYFSGSPRAFSLEKYNISRPILHSNIHHVLHLPQKVTLELHQVLRLPRKWHLNLQMLHLPRKVTPMLDPRHIWKLIYNARSNRCHHPTSPNTAPATKKTTAAFQRKFQKTDRIARHFQCGADPRMIRPWSEHETVSPHNASQPKLLFGLATSIFYWKIRRFVPSLTFKHSPSAAPATKSDTWTSPSTALATKSDTWTSPNTAPARRTRLLLHTLTSHDSTSHDSSFTLLIHTTLTSHYTLTSHDSYFTLLLLHTTLTSRYSYFTRLLIQTSLTSHYSYFTLLLLHTSLTSHYS